MHKGRYIVSTEHYANSQKIKKERKIRMADKLNGEKQRVATV